MLASLAVVTASSAIVTAPVLASVTSPLTATEAISVSSPTKILPSPLAISKRGALKTSYLEIKPQIFYHHLTVEY